MSQSINSSLVGNQNVIPQVAPADLARVTLLLAGMVVVSVAALLGGMQYIISVLALGLAVVVVRRPREAVPAGWLFMFAAMILLPSSARLQFIDSRYAETYWQMYYWAVGSLVIVLAGFYRIGLSSLLHAPPSLKAFFLVTIASTIFGLLSGNELGQVIRQLYGSMLLVLYFVIARASADEELLFRRLKVFGVLLAFAFFVYYASVFSQFGFHKEDTSLMTQAGIFAILLFVEGLITKRLPSLASSGVLLTVSVLEFRRHIILTFLFAVAVTLAVQSTTRLRRICYIAISLLIWLPSIFPSMAQVVSDQLAKVPAIYQRLPEGIENTESLMSRNLQLVVGANALLQSPLFGEGMGGKTVALYDQNVVEHSFVDNGWAYVIVRMGGAGILAFCWFLVTVLRCMSRQSLVVSVCFLAVLLVAFYTEPIFFQFTLSPIAGALAGILYAKKHPLSQPVG